MIYSAGSEVKVFGSNVGDPGSILGSGRSLEKEMVTHSSILDREIPWTDELGGHNSWGRKSQT